MRLSRLLGKKKRRETVSYIDMEPTVAAARAAGLSVNEYREREACERTGNESFVGRRDRIYDRLGSALAGFRPSSILEIGPGAAAFTEVFARDYPDAEYQIYELRQDWTQYLCDTYRVTAMPCDGRTLAATPDASIDLVHCHATFVYLAPIPVLEYIQECARVLRDGGYLLFDLHTEEEISYETAVRTISAEHRFQTIVPRSLLNEFFAANGLRVVTTFCAQHTLTTDTRYFVLRKQAGG